MVFIRLKGDYIYLVVSRRKKKQIQFSLNPYGNILRSEVKVDFFRRLHKEKYYKEVDWKNVEKKFQKKMKANRHLFIKGHIILREEDIKENMEEIINKLHNNKSKINNARIIKNIWRNPKKCIRSIIILGKNLKEDKEKKDWLMEFTFWDEYVETKLGLPSKVARNLIKSYERFRMIKKQGGLIEPSKNET